MGICSCIEKTQGEENLFGLTSPQLKKLPRFIPKIQSGLVIHVYDGDTITVAAKLNNELFKFSVRVLGVDTPEIKGSSASEKRAAIKARDFVRTLLLDKVVHLRNHVREKYGRVCASVILEDGRDLSEILIQQNLGVSYGGGTKIAFASRVARRPLTPRHE